MKKDEEMLKVAFEFEKDGETAKLGTGDEKVVLEHSTRTWTFKAEAEHLQTRLVYEYVGRMVASGWKVTVQHPGW